MASEKKSSDPRPSPTTVVGEENAPVTTLALGEEHVVTTVVGEQVQAGPELAKAGSATTVVGESWHPTLPVTTTVAGEEHHLLTTIAGEQSWPTTTVVGEEGWTTTVVGEQSQIVATTTVVGEEGPVTTTIVGEHHVHVPVTTTVAGEDNQGGGSFGQF